VRFRAPLQRGTGILPYGAQVLLILSFARGKLDFFCLISNAFFIIYFCGFYNSYLRWFLDKLVHRYFKI
jgi:hypothetical protein